MPDLSSLRPRSALSLTFVLWAVSAGCTNDVTLAEADGEAGAAGDTTPGTGGLGGAGNAGGNPPSDGGGGAQGGAGNTGPGPLPECETAADCQIVNDCCTCEGIPAGDTPEECLATCIQPSCEAVGHPDPEVQCIGGTCMAGFDCYSLVACATPPPSCPPGEVPHRTGGCWGGCVPATECAAVNGCSDCDLATQTCVQYIAFAGTVNCLPLPETCSGPADCACAADAFCHDPFESCTGNGGGIITCECTNC
jgi:hypothetical protein